MANYSKFSMMIRTFEEVYLSKHLADFQNSKPHLLRIKRSEYN